ncbi:MAG: acetyl-CoA carboxylase biotin carboxyl carrier protein [Acidobacteriota bacterium]
MSENTGSAKAKDGDIVVEKKRSGSRKSADSSFNMDEIRELAALVDEHGFTDFEFENENIRVRLSKMTSAPVYQAGPAISSTAAPVGGQSSTLTAVPSELVVDPDADLYKITSPIVGTFYRSPGPDKDAYVSEGSTVGPESTVCIVEAMKLMNEIQAETSGEIVRIYVENGQPVEYGQALFGVRK